MDQQQTLARAMDHHRAGELDTAMSIYREMLGAYPNNNAYYLLGLAECQSGEMDSGLARIAGTISRHAGESSAREQFRVFLRAALVADPVAGPFGSLPRVIENLWFAVASLEGRGDIVALEMAAVLADMGRWEEAATLYARAARHHPTATTLLDGWDKAQRHVALAFLRQAVTAHLERGAVTEAVDLLSRTDASGLDDREQLAQMALKTLLSQVHGSLGTIQTLHWHWKRLNFLRPGRRDNFLSLFNIEPKAIVASIPALVRRTVLLVPDDLEVLQLANILLTVCGLPEEAYALCRLPDASPTPARERMSAELAYLLRDHDAARDHYEAFLRLANASPAVEQPLPDDIRALMPPDRQERGEPVILTSHWGNPEFLPYVLAQNALSNPGSRVVLLGDSTNRYQGIEHYPLSDFLDLGRDFREIYKNKSYNGYCYELFCFDRWFACLQWMEENGVEEAYIVDSDLMIFENIAKSNIITDKDKVHFCGISGHFSFFTQKTLRNFCNYMIDMYRSSEHPLFNAQMVVDMSAVDAYQKAFPWVNLSKVDNGRYFDRNIQSFEDFAFHEGLKWIRFRPDPDGRPIPYARHEPSATEVRFCTLHFQGGSKRLIRDAFRGQAIGSEPPPLQDQASVAAASMENVFLKEEAYFKSLAERLEAQDGQR